MEGITSLYKAINFLGGMFHGLNSYQSLKCHYNAGPSYEHSYHSLHKLFIICGLIILKTTGIGLSTLSLLHSVLFNDSYTPQGYCNPSALH